MAQTIQIKRSTGSNAPSTLQNGELAYVNHSSLKKLYIGRPGGGTGDIDIIGGKDFVDKLDLIGDPSTPSPVATATHLGVSKLFSDTDQSITANTVSATANRTYGIQHNSTDQMVVNVPWTDTNETLAQTLVLGSTTGGTSINVSASDNINFSATSKAIFGGTSSTTDRLEIGYTVSGSTKTATIKETGSGRLKIIGQNLNLTADNSDDGIIIDTISGTNNLQTKIVSESDTVVTVAPSGFQLGSGSIVTTILDQDTMSSNSDTALATQQSIKTYVDGRFGNLSVSGSTIATSGTLITLGAAANENTQVAGNLTVAGNLNVTGDVNSTSTNNLDVLDKLITVGIGQSAGLAASGSGLKIDGDNARFLFNYDSGSSSSQFEIDEGDGNFHPVLHTGNSATQTYTIDGGTF